MADSFIRPAQRHSTRLEIKRSEFICQAAPTCGVAAANAFIEQVRRQYSDARHHCWCYVAGPPDDYNQWNCSDDGEPRGTAGKPMLNVLMHSGLGEVTVVVTRYFGGIKLGAGGLVRAYSQAVQQCLEQLPTETRVLTKPYELLAPHSLTGALELLIQQLDIEVLDRQWLELLHIRVNLSARQVTSLRERLGPYPSVTLKAV
jgi:uncharacterized YigZ family protein